MSFLATGQGVIFSSDKSLISDPALTLEPNTRPKWAQHGARAFDFGQMQSKKTEMAGNVQIQ